MKLILFPVLLFVAQLCFGQTNGGYLIKGQLSHAEGQKVYLIKRGQGYHAYEKTIFIDSAVVRNNSFVLKGHVKEPDYYSILLGEDWKYFVLENTTIRFNADVSQPLRQATVTGTKLNDDEAKLKSFTKPFIAKLNDAADSSFTADARGDSAAAQAYAKLNQSISKRRLDTIKAFIKAYPSSFVSLYELKENYESFGISESKALFNRLNSKLKSHSLGKDVQYALFIANELLALNKQSISFSLPDTLGRNIALSDFKGKYVLLDFWASWCMPCRAENPNLRTAYTQFKSKGFEIISVSLDNDKSAWQKAIAKDSLSWTNVSDLKGWENGAAKKYLVREVPTNYLINPQGMVIAKNLRSEALQKKLKELLGE